jgi:dGTPase
VLKEEDLRKILLWRQTEEEARKEHAALEADRRLRWRSVVRRLIRKLAADLLEETERRLARREIRTLAQVRGCPEPLVDFSAVLAARKAELETFLHGKFYAHKRVRSHTAKWQERLKALFGAYLAQPGLLPDDHYRRVAAEGEGLERVICDYVAGMTDRYAEKQWKRHCHPAIQNPKYVTVQSPMTKGVKKDESKNRSYRKSNIAGK